MAQGANARPHAMSTHRLLTPFRREALLRAARGVPVGTSWPGPLWSLSHRPRGTFTTKLERRHCPGCVPGSPAGQSLPHGPSSAPQRPPQPGSRPRGAPHLSGALPSWALAGTAQRTQRRETGKLGAWGPALPSPFGVSSQAAGASIGVLGCQLGRRSGPGAFWEAGSLGSLYVTTGASFPVRKPGLPARSGLSVLEKAMLEDGRQSSRRRGRPGWRQPLFLWLYLGDRKQKVGSNPP